MEQAEPATATSAQSRPTDLTVSLHLDAAIIKHHPRDRRPFLNAEAFAHSSGHYQMPVYACLANFGCGHYLHTPVSDY